MSANVQEPNAARKRSHDEFSGDEGGEDTTMNKKTPSKQDVRPSGDSLLPPVSNNLVGSSPQGSPALTEAGSSTAACNSPSPETPTKAGADQPAAQTSNPTVKRKKLTPAEKEAREKEAAEKKEQKEREAAQKKKERDEKAAVKAAEKAKQEEEKLARQQERDEKRKKKEEEEKLKAEQREEKKKQKEEEEKRLQEEKDKKARAQPKLSNFFVKPATPKKIAPTLVSNSSPAKATDTPDEVKETTYQKMFRPFYIKDNTRMAPSSCNMDEETRELKSKILDECIAGERQVNVKFDPVSLFSLPGASKPRGKQHHPVRHIMEAVYKQMEQSGTTASADIIQAARRKLVGVPVKVIAFSRDVRPPYYGTVTYRPFAMGQGNMRRVARRSASRRLQLEYDYDSEAEWQEEEGEDLDADDDDEELDDEDDMDGFLDDSEDSGLTRRTFGNTMEPESTGICFENENRKTSDSAATDNKMEMILDVFHKNAAIDPFATSYWEPEPKPVPKTMQAATTDKMPPPPAPANAFAALNGGTDAPAKLVKAELMNDVKKAILQNKALSKVGIVDFIFQQFRDSTSRIEVKNTLELVAEKKKGTGKAKEWDLKPGHEISL